MVLDHFKIQAPLHLIVLIVKNLSVWLSERKLFLALGFSYALHANLPQFSSLRAVTFELSWSLISI